MLYPETARGLNKVLAIYKARNLRIDSCCADNEFGKIRDDIRPIPLEIVAREEHVPRIERAIRTLKERARCDCHGLPYKACPITMTIALVELANHWLNQFPEQDGISDTLSPSAIVLGTPKPDCNRLKICFGSYAQVFDSTDNTMQRRSTPAIALLPSNQRGGLAGVSIVINGRNCQYLITLYNEWNTRRRRESNHA